MSVDETTLVDSVEWETDKLISLPPIEEVPILQVETNIKASCVLVRPRFH